MAIRSTKYITSDTTEMFDVEFYKYSAVIQMYGNGCDVEVGLKFPKSSVSKSE